MKSKSVLISIIAAVAVAPIVVVSLAALYQYNELATLAHSPKVATQFAKNAAEYVGNDAVSIAKSNGPTYPNTADVQAAVADSTALNVKTISYSDHQLKLQVKTPQDLSICVIADLSVTNARVPVHTC